ncbi:Gfo/Idh/MocA family oxidoreductase [Acidisoma cladoniae]|uniref:Gfo/Idh/MocA family oxidoreductase n=1 Tax=Acidisoma cladoniae TaxID=3040935 RepID=UPI00254BA245|nr:Gfo/Idh/MocA family oxidoreductase [Acidisoma sp. PAMC 29798]
MIIGAGRIAAVHALSVSRAPRLKLVAFVDPAAGAELPDRWDVPCFPDLASATEATHPDALVIASPTATHTDYIYKACDLGLPVLCEKPVAFRREAIVDIIDHVRAANLPVILGFHRRFDPARREMHHRVASQEIGRVQHILQLSRDPMPPTTSQALHQGGIVSDMVVHDLDELLWLVGRFPDRIDAQLDQMPGVGPNAVAVDTAHIQLSWAEGPVAQISATRQAVHGFEQRLEIFGAAGRLICNDPRVSEVILDAADDTRVSRRHAHFWDRYRPAYQAEIDHLAEILAEGSAPQCTLTDGLRAHDLVEMVNRVAKGRGADISSQLAAGS